MNIVNADKPHKWKADTYASVDLYNNWFLRFAPEAFRDSRIQATKAVEEAFKNTAFLFDISVRVIKANPGILPILRMSTCPPIAVDRLAGLADISKSIMDSVEKKQIIPKAATDIHLTRMLGIIDRLLDRDIFPWLGLTASPEQNEAHRAATIVADRYCGALSNPIIRNAQEIRQLQYIESWLTARGYQKISDIKGVTIKNMRPGTFSFRMNVPLYQGEQKINLPVDAVVKPLKASESDLAVLIEAKSAGDYTNVNKRRKEEAQKYTMLKNTYGGEVRFVLFLCGYFDAAYLGYCAAEGLDWVWEHRIDDLSELGL